MFPLPCLWPAFGALLILAAPASAEARSPHFADYPEKPVAIKVMKLPLPKEDKDDDYKLRRHDAIPEDARANFAGRYYMLIFGCGSACVNAAIIEAESGRIIEVPFSISGWRRVHDDFRGVEFRHNSRLVVFNGERNEEPADMGRHYYVFENGALKHLRSEKVKSGNFMRPAR